MTLKLHVYIEIADWKRNFGEGVWIVPSVERDGAEAEEEWQHHLSRGLNELNG